MPKMIFTKLGLMLFAFSFIRPTGVLAKCANRVGICRSFYDAVRQFVTFVSANREVWTTLRPFHSRIIKEYFVEPVVHHTEQIQRIFTIR
ncbi:MAG: hypothetical protein KBE23_02525 [Chloroflexi bacterium]|nr:hypothetical protein [Chloroflexota bacterium]MBP7041588.1 hypothetical protein [Chloroflexota bacterium]